jgi:hypothetical protein
LSETSLDLNANLNATTQVTSFNATMTLEFTSGFGAWGNGQPDGLSFSLGNPATMNANEEVGVSSRLSIRINPFNGAAGTDDAIAIVWNGTILERTSFVGNGAGLLPGPFIISVNAAGRVTASYGTYSTTATFPASGWSTTSQNGWDFVLAGRTGGNAGTAGVDDMNVTAEVRQLDGAVTGIAGNDVIDTSYVGDLNGDRIDANDGTGDQGKTGNADLVYAGAGNDSIVANLGNDIIYGGTGDDIA